MRARQIATVSALAVVLALSAPALAAAYPQAGGDGPPVRGFPVRLELSAPFDLPTGGELLAATEDSLWLLHQGEVDPIALARIERVSVERSSFGARQVAVWSALAGLGSGVALTAACSSVEGAACGGILPSTLATWAVIGLLSAVSIESARFLDLERPGKADLQPYARFPQGLPPRFSSPAAGIREDDRDGGPDGPGD